MLNPFFKSATILANGLLLAGIVFIVYNGGGIWNWAFLVFMMLVWPMGSKPKGMELAILLASWLILALMEAVHIRHIIPKIQTGRA